MIDADDRYDMYINISRRRRFKNRTEMKVIWKQQYLYLGTYIVHFTITTPRQTLDKHCSCSDALECTTRYILYARGSRRAFCLQHFPKLLWQQQNIHNIVVDTSLWYVRYNIVTASVCTQQLHFRCSGAIAISSFECVEINNMYLGILLLFYNRYYLMQQRVRVLNLHDCIILSVRCILYVESAAVGRINKARGLKNYQFSQKKLHCNLDLSKW